MRLSNDFHGIASLARQQELLMLSPLALTVFYTICGIVVAFSLFRIWRRNRVGKSKTPLAGRVDPLSQISPRPETRASVAAVERDYAYVPGNVGTDIRSVSSASAVGPAVTASYAPPPALNADNDMPSSSWQGRRLLETTGILPRHQETMPRVLPEDVPGVDDRDRTFGRWLNPAFASLLPESPEKREDARRDLQAGGYYNPHALENLAATRYALMMLGVVVFGALLLLVPPQLEPLMVACCILAPLLGWALPALYVRSKAKERKQEIERAMPDFLDMLNMCVGQGLTVPDSFRRIGRDFRSVYPALSQELGIVDEQARIGSMQTALENFSRRIDMPEVHSLTSLLIQTERMGTSISQALTTYSDTMRESQRQQADEKGNRATFRLLFPTVLCLMPAVYLFLLGPAVNELQKFFYGGGQESLNNGSQVVQRVNSTRSRNRNSTQAADRNGSAR
jgi:tight adherence protein C